MTLQSTDLSPEESVEGRPFADPDHIPSDRSMLGVLIRDVHRRLGGTRDAIAAWTPSPERWHRRVLIPRPEAFDGLDRVVVVGFFGRVRDQVAPEVAARIHDLSTELEQRIHEVPGVLAYSTQLLADEHNYANLVMLDRPETIDVWRKTAPHPTAAGTLSAAYYAFIRIYRGSIAMARLADEGAVCLEQVMYWDYRSQPPWAARRRL